VFYFIRFFIAFTFSSLLLNFLAIIFKMDIAIISLHKLLNIINVRLFILTFFFLIILSLLI